MFDGWSAAEGSADLSKKILEHYDTVINKAPQRSIPPDTLLGG